MAGCHHGSDATATQTSRDREEALFRPKPYRYRPNYHQFCKYWPLQAPPGHYRYMDGMAKGRCSWEAVIEK